VIAGGVAVLGLMLAPALDGDQPWWDYETWALSAASARSTTFTWEHSYGPLNWPRDGRELLRVRARQAAYWKTENLDRFDGQHWVRAPTFNVTRPLLDVDDDVARQWTQTIEVRVRNLRSDEFVIAGMAEQVESPTVRDFIVGDGTYRAGRTLRRGDAYTARVYTPAPNSRLRRDADPPTAPDLAQYLRFSTFASELGQTGTPAYQVESAPFGEPGIVNVYRGDSTIDRPELHDDVLERGPYRRTWALAQRIRSRSSTVEDVVDEVTAHLADGYTYSEQPGEDARNLEGFLFDSKAGYCQHFSGAMALLLRMAGVPARVSTGFTSGSLDRKTREYVVRDLDAHSWVEVFYPGYGWVTFDPTPAASPARSQIEDDASGAAGGRPQRPPGFGGDLPADPGRRTEVGGGGPPWGWIALGAVAGLLAGVALFRRARNGRPSALEELQRALARTRRDTGPATTLSALEGSFARTPGAAGYVRAIRNQRYGPAGPPPTLAQRRGLRAELARGAGLLGALRAWWALPPRPR
jgi:transglutaminase-like putative cysteine protease